MDENSRNGGEMMELTVTAVYVKDTRHYHLFQLEEGQPVKGSLYFPRNAGTTPPQIVIALKTNRKEKP